MTRKTKPLFEKIEILQTDSVQDRRQKVARLSLQNDIDQLEVDLISCSGTDESLFALDKFKKKFRKILKNL